MSLLNYFNAQPAGVPVLLPNQQRGAVRRVSFLTTADIELDCDPATRVPAWVRNGPKGEAQIKAYENQQSIIRHLREHGECGTRDISAATGLEQSTVLKHLRTLLELKVVRLAVVKSSRRTYVLDESTVKGGA
jgi:hypothetical protein